MKTLSFSFFGIDKETFENTYNKKILNPNNTIEIGGLYLYKLPWQKVPIGLL